jgi:hypothetical protein
MILIFSSGIYDKSTDIIIEYLKSEDLKYFKITPYDIAFNNQIEILNDNIYIKLNDINHELNIDKITTVFLRKWNVENEINHFLLNKTIPTDMEGIKNVYIKEINAISNYLFHRLKKCRWFPYFDSLNTNKLIQSFEAAQIGFHTPNFILTSCSKNIDINENNKKITKLIDSQFLSKTNNGGFFSYTNSLENCIIQDTFFPSYIQNSVMKDFEIRVFFIDNKMFSFAIFSQENDMSLIDSRKSDLSNKVRISSYCLTEEVEKKIILLMNNLNLSTGSIDLIMSIDGGVYFLEVNPFGQFNSLSFDSNYFIEKEIVKIFKKYYHEKK